MKMQPFRLYALFCMFGARGARGVTIGSFDSVLLLPQSCPSPAAAVGRKYAVEEPPE